MKSAAPLSRQRGVALWMVLLTLIMAGGLGFYRSANLQLNKSQQQVSLSSTMARAKEALIAYAVTNDARPGSLPCPDLNPADGQGDFFTAGVCPSNVGWLPWISPLDLPELVDDSGTRLWYVIAPNYRNHSSAHPINSDTASGLTVDGISNEIVALIIAPRRPLGSQNRPSNTPTDYLDGENGNGNDNIYVTGPPSDTFNDVVLLITRQELMAAVEKRVANEINTCLAQHAASAANTDKRYPWPAPITSITFQGNTNTLFGRVPDTQPSSGLDAQLKASITKLTEAELAVTNAADANKQLAALTALSQNVIEARNLFDAMYTAFNKIKQAADATHSGMLSIENAVTRAGTRISRSEGTTIRSLSAPTTTDSSLDALTAQLGESGIDVFPWELKRLNASLVASSDAASLKAQATAIQSLLAASSTPRTDINIYLTPASTAASIVVAAANAALTLPGDATLLLSAQVAAAALKDAISQLITSVDNSRVSILSGQVSDYVPSLESLNLTLKNTPTPENAATLLTSLSSTKKSVEAIKTGVSTIVSARNTTAASLATVISALQAAGTLSYAPIDSSTTTALNDIKTLAATIASNELIDNNVSRTSLNTAVLAYQTARSSFINVDTATPRPLQSSIAPYARTLSNATVYIDIWAKSISDNATAVAPQAKAAPVPGTTDPTTVTALGSSAYTSAGNTLTSMTGKGESADLLQTYINTPNTANQTQAITALAETTALVNNLLTQANTLDNDLSATTASAMPLIWLASRCDFLLTNKATWWSNNQWANTVFYQIGAPLMATAGKLTINGSGSYRVVSIAAGKAFSSQNHGTLTIANFLEDLNADSSRDGQALTPATGFVSKPVTLTPTSKQFNDRLAY